MNWIAIIGLITVVVGAVVAGMSAWTAWKQKNEKKDASRGCGHAPVGGDGGDEEDGGDEGENISQSSPPSPPSPSSLKPKRPTTYDHTRHSLPPTSLSPPERMQKLVSTLSEFLESSRWKEADQETLRVMLKIADREKEGWLDLASIQNFPCEDLHTIDHLWLESSNGRFGFSLQKRIWKSLGGNLKADDKIYEAFGDRVGWRVNKKWLQIDDLTFKPSAPVGHLPSVAVRLGGLSWGVTGFWWGKREAYVFLLSQKNW